MLMNHRPSRYLTGVSTLMFLAISSTTAADNAGEKPLFASHRILEVRIEAPITTLMKKRPNEEYLDGTFSYALADGTEITLDLKIRTRGKYRRRKQTCALPPIRLNFRKGQLKDTEFAGQDKLKLVTHCKTRNARYEQLVLREFLAYRILQALTDKSFGARLMRVTYVDTDQKEETLTRYGFVIEDDEDVSDRLGLELVQSSGISYEGLDPRQTNLIAVFEYMIGNTDFSMIRGPANESCCHNVVLFKSEENVLTPIPYDFDFSGLVNAPYAEPNPRFNIRSVRQRIYRGRCSNNQYLNETLTLFRDKEPEVRALIAGLSDLAAKYEKEVSQFLDKFYENIGSEQGIEKHFTKKCS